MHPFDKSERRISYDVAIRNVLVNDYGIEDDYKLNKIISAILDGYLVYEHVEIERFSFARRLANVVLWPIVMVSMPVKWLFTGTYYYDTNKGIGKYLKKILID